MKHVDRKTAEAATEKTLDRLDRLSHQDLDDGYYRSVFYALALHFREVGHTEVAERVEDIAIGASIRSRWAVSVPEVAL